ncbi:tRNA m(1)G methyltransferase Trm10 [Mucor ambiguus]|uniref:tRNA (guanine(9)-N1)-methyltransferase n=1 Tax=Mucor ambiguus TaxID=91626 RepID=A0A0C9MQB7_9FUNG|nr:tRNA m(1)G methyltransferase Trm10 [Mucor ambiguus]
MSAAGQDYKDTPVATAEATEPKGNIRTYQGKQYDITDPKFQGLSKNAIKKILRDEIWEETKSERTKGKREKFKRKRAERRQLERDGAVEPLPKRPKAKHMTVGKVGVILDCSFTSYMNDKEISSMRQQIVRCYSANVRAEKESMQMALTSLDEPLKKQLDAKAPSWENWRNFQVTSEPYLDKFNKEDLIYLSADSENVAHELEEGKTYIIGVQNLCNDKAASQGIKTAQLPIGDYIRLASRKVLTVNQVVEIMVKWLDYRDWEKAFMEVIPERKLKESTFINQHGEEEKIEEEEEEDEDEEKATEDTTANQTDQQQEETA